jgi:hypothetical protein
LNDIIPPGKTAFILALGNPLVGTATIGANNTATYTAPITGPSTTLRFTFTVTVQDNSGATSTSQVVVTVISGPVPPITGNYFTWVTPPPTDDPWDCDRVCSAALGSAWRAINGGGDTWRMCAGLIDLPQGLGRQWLVGKIGVYSQFCDITCATSPCRDMPSCYVPVKTQSVFAGATNSAQNAEGDILLQEFPMKCACTSCEGSPCDAKLWTPSASSSSCPQPVIIPQPGESFPSSVYSKIWASNEGGTFDMTGWVPPSHVSDTAVDGCAVDAGTAAEFVRDYDVLCYQGSK